jgi:cysteine desulfuration protein SufE
MLSIKEVQAEIIDEFAMFDDWMQRYEYLIDLIEGQYKTSDNIIKGCQSQVWLHAEGAASAIRYTADSDAILTKGLIALLVRVFDSQRAEEIAAADVSFIDQIGLKEHLSPTRANGLLSMVKQMKFYALAMQGVKR